MNLIYRQMIVTFFLVVLMFALYLLCYIVFDKIKYNKARWKDSLISSTISTIASTVIFTLLLNFSSTWGYSFIIPNVNGQQGKLEKVEFDKTIKDTYPLKDSLPNVLTVFRNTGTKLVPEEAYGGMKVHTPYTTQEGLHVPTSIEVLTPSPTIFFIGYNEKTGEPVDTILEVVDDDTWRMKQGDKAISLPNLSTLYKDRDGEESRYIYLSSKTLVVGDYLPTITMSFNMLCDQYHDILLQTTIYNNEFLRRFI